MPARKTPPRKSSAKPAKAKPDSREILLAAGLRLLARGLPASQLTPKGVAAEAGVTPATLTRSFPRFPGYMAGILRRLSEEVRAETLEAIGRKPPGPELIRQAITTYLDAVLRRPALPEISLTMRSDPACLKAVKDRMDSLIMLATLQLKMAGFRNPEGLGRLGIAMLFEIAHTEYEARRALPEFRQTIDAYFIAHR